MKLPHTQSRSEERIHTTAKPTLTNVIAIVVAGMGSFVFGYANNTIAGSLAQTSFIEKFLSGSDADSIISGIMGAFLGGCLLGAIVQSPVSNYYGRRIATSSAALLMAVSGALQAGSVHIAMFIVARFLCGISGGMLITNCPVYMSEISPPHIRGTLVANHAISIVYAYILSSIMALAFHYVTTSYQWRLQYVLLAVFGLLLFGSTFILPESPRWLCEHRHQDEALKVLERLHQSKGDSDISFASAEMAQIEAQIEIERELPRGVMHIIRTKHLRHRAACSILTWIMVQSTGIIVIATLTPTLFRNLGFDTVMQLGLSVVCISLICEAVLQKFYIGSMSKSGLNAAVAFYFLFVFFYGSTIDCTGYVYLAEIWPTNLRSYGTAIGIVASFSCAIAYTSPASLAFAQIGWKYYWVMIPVCIVTSTVIFFICPETARLTLEEIDALFSDEVAPVGHTKDPTITHPVGNTLSPRVSPDVETLNEPVLVMMWSKRKCYTSCIRQGHLQNIPTNTIGACCFQPRFLDQTIQL
ncbi:hypothetical protein FE257_004017 [Aspergillus nanangensis]|uniref:Major facilitator superfamily (MFS) profile domain-containing protein n=1 Tax=Aspergillus nanangensis TaxID=2582783 RepID=A0AAD4GWC7_ASPNN|nr:hypothetical protein FE257_004017 [Aspergillus nanangensis]